MILHFSQVLYEMMDELSKECYLCGFSETTNPVVHTYACTQIKDKLIEDWKSGSGCIGSWTPRFNPEPDQSTNLQPQVPTMKVCKMENDVPVIPKEVRERWLNDPVRRSLIYIIGNILLAVQFQLGWVRNYCSKLQHVIGQINLETKTPIGECDSKTLMPSSQRQVILVQAHHAQDLILLPKMLTWEQTNPLHLKKEEVLLLIHMHLRV